ATVGRPAAPEASPTVRRGRRRRARRAPRPPIPASRYRRRARGGPEPAAPRARGALPAEHSEGRGHPVQPVRRYRRRPVLRRRAPRRRWQWGGPLEPPRPRRHAHFRQAGAGWTIEACAVRRGARRHPQGAFAGRRVTGAPRQADERALAIVNPVAGNGAGERIASRIAAEFRDPGMRVVRDARRRTIDVGEVNGRVFVNSAGVGIDGHVAQRIAATSRVVGKTFGYLAGSLVGIATYRPQPMRVLVDGELHSGRFLTVVAANGTHFGSGMHVAPDASLDDGHLDVLLAGDLSRWSSLVALAKLYRGTHVDCKTIVMKRARVVEIELERPLRAQLDGETTTAQRFSIRIRPGALEVLTK